MAVLERYKELGMLMAIGMNKAKIFFMIVLETLMLSCRRRTDWDWRIGFLTVYLLQDTGIDLSAFAKGLGTLRHGDHHHPRSGFWLIYARIAFAVFHYRTYWPLYILQEKR